MKGRLIIDGNAVYEIDEECMEFQKERKKGRENRMQSNCVVRYQDSKGAKQRGR